MVMIFANQKVREYLLEHGLVYTYRKDHRKTADGIRPQTGRDWATDRRTGNKIADIFITPMEPIDSLNMGQVLARYVRESGFYQGSIDEGVSHWSLAIAEYVNTLRLSGWIYRVEVIGADN